MSVSMRSLMNEIDAIRLWTKMIDGGIVVWELAQTIHSK